MTYLWVCGGFIQLFQGVYFLLLYFCVVLNPNWIIWMGPHDISLKPEEPGLSLRSVNIGSTLCPRMLCRGPPKRFPVRHESQCDGAITHCPCSHRLVMPFKTDCLSRVISRWMSLFLCVINRLMTSELGSGNGTFQEHVKSTDGPASFEEPTHFNDLQRKSM